MARSKRIVLGKVNYNAEWLRSVTEQKALIILASKFEVNQIKNAWKQANGFSVPNYSKKSKKKPEIK